jgi:hypothetical protein
MNNMKINAKFNTCANVVYFDNTSEMANNEQDESSMFTTKRMAKNVRARD